MAGARARSGRSISVKTSAGCIDERIRRSRARQGGIALEAALIMPLVLMLLTLSLGLLAAAAAESKLKGALDRTAAELSLLSPLCDLMLQNSGELLPAPQLLPGVNGFPEAGADLADFELDFGKQEIVAQLLIDGMLDLASSALFGPFILQRIDYWLEKGEHLQPAFTGLIYSKQLYLDFRIKQNQLWLCLSYEIQLPLFRQRRFQQALVPLWLGRGEENAERADGQVWLLDNFSRGQILRQAYGGNLPYDFPVISCWDNGEAVSIKSIDLTAPTYQNPGEVKRRLISQIDQLAAFDGAVHQRADSKTVIRAADIRKRRLILVVPENSPAAALEIVNQAAAYAQAIGISLDRRSHGSSTRYNKSGEDD